MLVLYIDNGNGEVDYSRYVADGSIQIQDSINVPTLLDFTLANVDNSFQPPVQNAYVRLYSTKFGRNVVTGFVTNVPSVSYLGRSQNVPGFNFQVQQYAVQVTSDEWLLNVKAVPFLPAFVNQTQGQILAALASILAPGFFDTSQMQGGVLVPYLQYDPTQKWSDLAKQFGDASRYRYKVIGRTIIYAPFGDAPLGVSYDDTGPDRTFDPTKLQTNVLAVPPVNEAIVVGDTEPQQMHDDYFMGDGFSGQFDLRHKVFNGATNALLQDDWTEATFNSSYWKVYDPFANYVLSQGSTAIGALNVVSPASQSGTQLGQSYILAQNGLELGGHLVLQHGDFTFVDVCTGLVGAVFSGAQAVLSACVCAFSLFSVSGTTVVPSPSGAQGINIQPVVNGANVGPIVQTQINHQYVLTTQIDAKQYTRFSQPYTSLAGTVFGNENIPSAADLTFVIQDIDEGHPFNQPLTTTFTVTGAQIPSFGTYAIVANQRLNLNVNYTLLYRPPQCQLSVVGLTGASGGMLPLFPPGSSPPAPIIFPMGFGMQNQTATITNTNGDTDELSFYAGQILQSYVASAGAVATTVLNSTIPAPGARIRLTSWESGRALADIQDPTLVAQSAVVAGDDGRRMAVFTDLNPLPRTSDECEQAALAQIADRSNAQYQGSYTVFDYFWNGFGADYPFSGRFIPVNSPQRGILNQNLFVNQVTTTVIEMHDEILQFAISFGQDLFLEKLIARFIPNPANVILPNDAAQAPTLQFINEVGATFLPNLVNAQITKITGATALVDLGALPVTGCEVRRADYGWGSADQNLIGVFSTQTFSLARSAYEQIFYMRQVNGSQISRFTRTMRIVQPLIPSAPIGTVDASNPLAPVITLLFTGDIRNIYGIEIRASDNATVLLQKVVLSPSDLVLATTLTANPTLQYYCYFFNLRWEYSAAGIPAVKVFGSSHASYVPLSNPLTAVDAGASATIDIAQFIMLSGGVEATVFSGSITLLSYNTLYYVYYDDPLFVGNAVTYHATTVKANALQGTNRYFVGSIQTPRATAPATIGNGDGGTGAQTGIVSSFGMQVMLPSTGPAISGNGTISDPQLAVDGDATTFMTMEATGNSATNEAIQYYGFPAGVYARWNSFTLNILRALPTNTLSNSGGTGVVYQSFFSFNGNFIQGGPGTVLVDTVDNDGTTLPLSTIQYTLPIGVSISNLVLIFAITVLGIVSGSIILEVYEVWVEGVS